MNEPRRMQKGFSDLQEQLNNEKAFMEKAISFIDEVPANPGMTRNELVNLGQKIFETEPCINQISKKASTIWLPCLFIHYSDTN